ncbi:MAG: F0F1 ATP synthase subunit delta [Geminicoccaceae bacterium]|nr:MAG: F0F1 ATP synthase subunit delta [Geminicoccaceae bacterium]
MSDSAASDAGLADRYAKALFDLAEAGGSLDQVAADLRSFTGFLRASPELARTLPSPMVPTEVKIGTIKALAEKAGFQPLTVQFLGVVATQNRLDHVAVIIDAYLQQVATFKGEVQAEVMSAAALDDAELAAVQEMIAGAVGKKVRLEASVDPSLLAGMIVRVGSRMVDASLKTKLRNLELAMRGAG